MNSSKTRLSKRLIVLATAVVLTVTTIAPLPALAQGETAPISGTFGQPHGDIASGDIRFVLETTGPVDRAIFNVVKEEEPDEVLDSITMTEFKVYTGYEEYRYFDLIWDSTGFDDGDYRLYGYVECDDCGENGTTLRYVAPHFGGGYDYLMFVIKNPVVPPAPSSEPAEDSCGEKLEEANAQAQVIYDKQNNNLLYIDSFLQKTNIFYEKNNLELASHQTTLGTIAEMRKTASDNLVALDAYKVFSCDASLKDQVDNFLTTSADTRDSLDKYKNSVINLILEVLEEA